MTDTLRARSRIPWLLPPQGDRLGARKAFSPPRRSCTARLIVTRQTPHSAASPGLPRLAASRGRSPRVRSRCGLGRLVYRHPPLSPADVVDPCVSASDDMVTACFDVCLRAWTSSEREPVVELVKFSIEEEYFRVEYTKKA